MQKENQLKAKCYQFESKKKSMLAGSKLHYYAWLKSLNLERKFAACIFFFFFTFSVYADRIYILPGTGYNQAGSDIIAAITSLGHTVVTGAAGSTTLPAGFTSKCVDPVNGYHWLCLFGVEDYTPLQTQIKAFIDAGGKVYYQHEVSCCVVSSTSAATIASAITGLTITPNVAAYIAFSSPPPAWEAVNTAGCTYMAGDAYKCMDGVPLGHTLNATANLNGASPPYTDCENFGMYFETTDFIGTPHNGAFVAIGDINLFYQGQEPLNNGGTTPVDMNVINFFFPNELSTCFLFNPGCIITTSINLIESDLLGVKVDMDAMHDRIIVELKGNYKADVVITNIIGEQIKFFDAIKSDQFTISTIGLSQGIYFVKIVSEGKWCVKKILIE